jgi:hypothetical protein
MISKFAFHTVAGTFPEHLSHLWPSGTSFPDAEELKRSCEEMDRATERIAREREEYNRNTVGQRLCAAVMARIHRRQAPRVKAIAAPTAEEESFGEKLKKAVEKKLGRKEREERLKRERERYPKRRPHTKGE